MSFEHRDKYGHKVTPTMQTQLTAGAVGVVTAGTISGTTAAGAAPTITVSDATDVRGSFLLNAVTGGGAQAAGKTATVRFLNEYPKAPIVTVNIVNETDTTVVAGGGAASVTTAGFDIITPALTTAKAYRVNYEIEA